MPIEFEHSPRRIEDFQYELTAIGDRATDLYDVFDTIADMVLDREAAMFETRGATSGRYWSPLRDSTVRRKQRIPSVVDPFAPLRREDKLMRSLSVRDAEYQILEVSDDGFYLATEHPAAEYHASGTANMPARPPLIIPAKHAREYMQMIRDEVFGEENG